MRDDIFRKVALERLSSPEQLDQLLEITTPGLWLSLTAVFLIFAAALLWGFEGSIATEASGQGLLVRSGGVLNIEALGNGFVTKVGVTAGDHVKAGQIVASIAQPELLQKIGDTRDLLREAKSREVTELEVHTRAAKLQAAALQRQRENADRLVVVLRDRAKVLDRQVADQQELADSGIVARYQVLEAKQKLIDVQGQIANTEANIKQRDAQRFAAESEPAEADRDLKARVLNLEAELRGMEHQLKLASSVPARYSGEVLEVKVSPGSLVTSGTPLVSVQPEARQLEVVAYISARDVKNVHPGMDAQISPSLVKREEFGFVRGKVAVVADFPATPEAIMRNFENQPLVNNILRTGPMTEVRMELLHNARGEGSFLWSSIKSPAVTLSSGTLCTVEVVTQRQRPISLVLPWARSVGMN
jgi:HlyD family secretion protein